MFIKKVLLAAACMTAVIVFSVTSACAQNIRPGENGNIGSDGDDDMVNYEIVNVTVNGKDFEAEIGGTEAAEQFLALFPLTMEMGELNGNEKYFYLDTTLSSQPASPDEIKCGDIMLFGTDCVVVFYKTFSTSYAYTRLGRINNPEGLEEAAGNGSARVVFSQFGAKIG